MKTETDSKPDMQLTPEPVTPIHEKTSMSPASKFFLSGALILAIGALFVVSTSTETPEEIVTPYRPAFNRVDSSLPTLSPTETAPLQSDDSIKIKSSESFSIEMFWKETVTVSITYINGSIELNGPDWMEPQIPYGNLKDKWYVIDSETERYLFTVDYNSENDTFEIVAPKARKLTIPQVGNNN